MNKTFSKGTECVAWQGENCFNCQNCYKCQNHKEEIDFMKMQDGNMRYHRFYIVVKNGTPDSLKLKLEQSFSYFSSIDDDGRIILADRMDDAAWYYSWHHAYSTIEDIIESHEKFQRKHNAFISVNSSRFWDSLEIPKDSPLAKINAIIREAIGNSNGKDTMKPKQQSLIPTKSYNKETEEVRLFCLNDLCIISEPYADLDDLPF